MGAEVALSPNLAGRRLGRYEVLTQLASGGMASVYAARAQGVAGFERLVAIKVLHPHLAHEEEFISMFLDEARLAARIRHPNVVAIFDISDTPDAGFFLVMDYIEGDHLGGLLRRAVQTDTPLPPSVVVRIVLDALDGLSAAHVLKGDDGEPLNLVHRDISPHNIMVGADGVARLADFGVAKAEVRLSSTREGQFKGKLAYMAPEHASTGDTDQRSDLFSMAIILWESLACERLFRADNNAATLNKILREPIPELATRNPDLGIFDTLLQKALARPPEDRFQSAEEFLLALEALAKESCGIASTRDVAHEVDRLIGEKVQADGQRIRDSIDSLGRADIGEDALPIPGDGSASRSYRRSGNLPEVPLEPTLAGRPSARPPLELVGESSGSGNRSVWYAAAAALILITTAIVAAVILNRPEQDPGPRIVATEVERSEADRASAEAAEAEAEIRLEAEAAAEARRTADARETAAREEAARAQRELERAQPTPPVRPRPNVRPDPVPMGPVTMPTPQMTEPALEQNPYRM